MYRLARLSPASFALVAVLALPGTSALAQDLQRPDGWHVRFDNADAS